MNVAEALTEWFAGHYERGGEFNNDALEVAGYEATKAHRSGVSFAEAFEVGRTAFFARVGRESSVATSRAEAS